MNRHGMQMYFLLYNNIYVCVYNLQRKIFSPNASLLMNIVHGVNNGAPCHVKTGIFLVLIRASKNCCNI